MGRRNAGEGVIYQVSYKAPDGSAKRKKFAAKTKHEAMEKGKAFLLANQQGNAILKADMTVAAWIDEWMENYVKPRIRPRADGNALSPSTVRVARRYFAMCVYDAVREGLVLRNVVRLTKSPKLTRKEMFSEPISPINFSRQYFKPLLKECHINLDFIFHGLRHTHATLLPQQGVNPKIVQECLVHYSLVLPYM